MRRFKSIRGAQRFLSVRASFESLPITAAPHAGMQLWNLSDWALGRMVSEITAVRSSTVIAVVDM